MSDNKNVDRGPPKNILESDAEDPNRVRCGLTFVDKITGGGFMVPASYLLTGDSNAGKTTLCAQMADGFTQQGNLCLFNSLEMIEPHLKFLLKRLKLKNGFLASFEKEQLSLYKDLKKLVEENPGKHVVLVQDSLQSLARDETALDCLLRWNDIANRLNCTVIFIGQATKNGTYRGSSRLQHEVTGGHLHLSVESNDGYQLRKLEMKKNRAGPCESIFTELGERGHVETEVEDWDSV